MIFPTKSLIVVFPINSRKASFSLYTMHNLITYSDILCNLPHSVIPVLTNVCQPDIPFVILNKSELIEAIVI